MFIVGVVAGLCAGAFLWRRVSGGSSSSYVNFGSHSVNTIAMNGSRLIVNGEEYVDVISLTIETNTERKRREEKYVNLELQIIGETKGALTLTSGKVTVQGDCANVQTNAGSISVTGCCTKIETGTGTVTVGGDCSGSIKTQVGSVTVKGTCAGKIRTTVGSVRHG